MPDFYITYRLADGTDRDVSDPMCADSAEVALERFVNADTRPKGIRLAWVWANADRDGEALFTAMHTVVLTAERMPLGTRIADPEEADFDIEVGESWRYPTPQS